MATVVTTKKENIDNAKTSKRAPLFRKTNYILMGVGLVVLLIGYFCLKGGAVSDPNTFDGEIFNARRTVVSPILMFLGLVIEIVAIMWHPRAKKEETEA
ncbi:MAG: DUF3098 domain-containing protein [Bacteroidales bacterium]|nr:DUF3098 domain-containing protein [Bacteroidales bacterium]